MAKNPFSRDGETLLPVPLDPKLGGRAPMTSKGFEVDMGAAADKTRAMFEELQDNPDAVDQRGFDFETEYARKNGVTPEYVNKQISVKMPEIGHARNQKTPKLIIGTVGLNSTKSKMVRAPKLIGGAVDQTPIIEMLCPKCGAQQAGDWSQCKGTCPISFSPHFNK